MSPARVATLEARTEPRRERRHRVVVDVGAVGALLVEARSACPARQLPPDLRAQGVVDVAAHPEGEHHLVGVAATIARPPRGRPGARGMRRHRSRGPGRPRCRWCRGAAALPRGWRSAVGTGSAPRRAAPRRGGWRRRPGARSGRMEPADPVACVRTRCPTVTRCRLQRSVDHRLAERERGVVEVGRDDQDTHRSDMMPVPAGGDRRLSPRTGRAASPPVPRSGCARCAST